MPRTALLFSLALTLALASCDGGNGGAAAPEDTTPGADTIAGVDTQPDTGVGEDTPGVDAGLPPDTPAPTELSGWIRVMEHMGEEGSVEYATVDAKLWATPLPTTQERVDAAGDCVVLDGERMVGWLCDPECPWGEAACIDGACVPNPAPAPSGVMTLDGLKVAVTLTPTALGAYTVTDLPDDLFDGGDAVHLTSEGGDTPALDLSASGVEDIVADVWGVHFESGEDAVFTWEPGADPDARIQLLLQTGWHGATSTTTIWCETEDDGELVVPASLTAQFQIPSCGECEGSYIRRFSRETVDFGAGPIELMVASQRWFVPWWN